jgi:hypothetical protein
MAYGREDGLWLGGFTDPTRRRRRPTAMSLATSTPLANDRRAVRVIRAARAAADLDPPRHVNDTGPGVTVPLPAG